MNTLEQLGRRNHTGPPRLGKWPGQNRWSCLRTAAVLLFGSGISGCRWVRIFAVSTSLVLMGCSKQPTPPSAPEVTFKPKEMADALHAVIAADRDMYSRHILQ